MNRVIKTVVVAAVGAMSLQASGQMHLFDIKSGKVTYAISGSANMMGIQMQSKGEKRLLFDDYGAKNLTETVKTEKRSGMGGNQTEKSHTMTLMDGNTIYQVDFQRKQITRMENVGAKMLGGVDMKQKGLEMMKHGWQKDRYGQGTGLYL